MVNGVEEKFFVAAGNLLRKSSRRKNKRKNERKKTLPQEFFRHA